MTRSQVDVVPLRVILAIVAAPALCPIESGPRDDLAAKSSRGESAEVPHDPVIGAFTPVAVGELPGASMETRRASKRFTIFRGRRWRRRWLGLPMYLC
jgi:hypothetical protein